MPDPTMQQLALEVRQLRNEVSVLVQRFNAIEERARQPVDRAEPEAQVCQPADAAPAADADYQRAVALARGIITRPPGAGGDRS